MTAKHFSLSTKGRRAIVFLLLLSLPLCGILFLTWKDIYSPIPTFAELKEAKANGLRVEVAREVWGPTHYSFEFYDSLGRRYQTRSVNKSAHDRIVAALTTEVPVLIRYGRWRSPFPSSVIFSVYQLEVGNQVVVPYSGLADARRHEQRGGPWILLSTILCAGLATFIAFWREKKFQQQLAASRAGQSKQSHPPSVDRRD